MSMGAGPALGLLVLGIDEWPALIRCLAYPPDDTDKEPHTIEAPGSFFGGAENQLPWPRH